MSKQQSKQQLLEKMEELVDRYRNDDDYDPLDFGEDMRNMVYTVNEAPHDTKLLTQELHRQDIFARLSAISQIRKKQLTLNHIKF